MGLSHVNSIAQAKPIFHHPAQLHEPLAIIVLRSGAGLDQQYADGLAGAGNRSSSFQVTDAFHHQRGQTRVGAQTVCHVQLHLG